MRGEDVSRRRGTVHRPPAARAPAVPAPEMRAAVRPTRVDGSVDYHQLDRPTYLRNQDTVNKPQKPTIPEAIEERQREPVEFLDIPAFLRKREE